MTITHFNRLPILATVLLLTQLVACGSNSGEDGASSETSGDSFEDAGAATTTADESDISPLVVAGPQDGGEDAAVTGQVAWSSSTEDCVYVVRGTKAEGAVWPADTTWDNATDEVVLPSGDRLAIGDAFEASGGYYTLNSATAEGGGLTAEVLAKVEACGWQTFVYIQSS